MDDVVIREFADKKGRIHRIMEIPLKTFLREHDFEAVVRCKDCLYRDGNACDYSAVYVRPNGYCQWGRRKEDETD